MPLDPSVPLSVRPFQGVNLLAIQENQRRQDQEARLAEQDKFEQEKYAAARQELAQQQESRKAVGEAYQSAGGNRQELLNQLAQRGQGHLIPGVVEQFNKIDKSSLELEETQARIDELKRKREDAQKEGVGRFGAIVEAMGNDQNAWNWFRGVARDSNGKWGTEEDLAPFDAAIAQDPTKVAAITGVLQRKAQPKAQVGKTRLVTTPNPETGEPEQRIVADEPGQSFPLVPKAQQEALEGTVPVVRVNPRTGKVETLGEVPKGSHFVQEPAPPAASGSGGAEPGLTKDSIEDLATSYRILGVRAFPTRISGKDREKAMNEASSQRRLLGQNQAAEIQKQAAFQADKSALTKMKNASSAAQAFEDKAVNQIDMIKGLSTKVPRTSFPLINSALQAGRTSITGDTNATQLANAIDTFTAEYAKIISGATGSSAAATDSARAASAKLLNAAMSKGTMNDVLNLMQREMRLTIKGYDTVIGDIGERMGGQPASTTPAAQVPAAGGRRDPLGIR